MTAVIVLLTFTIKVAKRRSLSFFMVAFSRCAPVEYSLLYRMIARCYEWLALV